MTTDTEFDPEATKPATPSSSKLKIGKDITHQVQEGILGRAFQAGVKRASELSRHPPERVVTWISFADTNRSLGVVILQGIFDPVQAAVHCHSVGINPGGECFVVVYRERRIATSSYGQDVFNTMWNNAGKLLAPDAARTLLGAKRPRANA